MDAASEAGAALVGSSEVVRGVKVRMRGNFRLRYEAFISLIRNFGNAFQRGKIMLPDFDFIIAHPNILAELTVIRGLLRKNFPSLENGIPSRITTVLYGVALYVLLLICVCF